MIYAKNQSANVRFDLLTSLGCWGLDSLPDPWPLSHHGYEHIDQLRERLL